jgi:hypothetical protein
MAGYARRRRSRPGGLVERARTDRGERSDRRHSHWPTTGARKAQDIGDREVFCLLVRRSDGLFKEDSKLALSVER